jgi:hypothetical protein
MARSMLPAKSAVGIIALALCSPWIRCQTPPTSSLIYAPLSNTFNALPPEPSAQLLASPDPLARSAESRSASSKSSRVDKLEVHPFSTFAIGIQAGSLGAGIEAATPLSRSLNLRIGANFIDWKYAFNIDGINYDTNINFRNGQASIDWFPFHGGFHISPGVLYFRNGLSGTALVPPGQPFTLSNTSYINSVDDPVGGTASVTYGHNIAPTLMFGMSNIIPRNGRHFSMPFEFGAAYTQAPLMNVILAGTACTVQGCFNAGTDPDTQANLKQEISDINQTVKKIPVFPIVSLGFAVRF